MCAVWYRVNPDVHLLGDTTRMALSWLQAAVRGGPMREHQSHNSIRELVQKIRDTGSAAGWLGDRVVAAAVAAVFGDDLVAGLPESSAVDLFAVTVTTCWTLALVGDECPGAEDPGFYQIDPNVVGGWGISAASSELLSHRLAEIYRSPGCRAYVASLAAFAALCLDQDAAGAALAIREARSWFEVRNAGAATAPHAAASVPRTARASATWIRDAALGGARQRSHILSGTPGAAAGLRDNPRAECLFAEFGYAALWQDDNASSLESALIFIYPYCAHDSASRAAPDFADGSFTTSEDAFYRRILVGRLSKLWVGRASAVIPWPMSRYQALLPFACYVLARASTDCTRDLAFLLGQISLAERREVLRGRLLRRRVSELSNAGGFMRRLYSGAAILLPVLGFICALPANFLAASSAAVLAAFGLVLAAAFVHRVRRTAHYAAVLHPFPASALAGLLLGGLYTAGRAAGLWLADGFVNHDEIPGLLIGFPIAIVILAFAVRRGATFRIPQSDWLPEGLPLDVEEQFDELFAGSEFSGHPTWESAVERGATAVDRSALPTALGRPAEALAASRQAVRLLRQLAAVNPAAYEADLAVALHDLGCMLSQASRYPEALAPIAEETQINRKLAAADPETFEGRLASSLYELGWVISQTGNHQESLAPTEEAVGIRRRLARANSAYEGSLAASLYDLSHRFREAGRLQDALAPAEEAVRVRRRLVQANPAAHEGVLAASLHALGEALREAGRLDDALAATEEAIGIYRQLARANPVNEGFVALLLRRLSEILAQVGDLEECQAPLEEAVQIYRRLAEISREQYENELKWSLFELAQAQWRLCLQEEALTAMQESASISRRRASADGNKPSADLATSLYELGWMLTQAERYQEALHPTWEAVRIRYRLTRSSSAARENHLTDSLLDLDRVLQRIAPQESLAPAAEAVQICRHLVQTNPAEHEPSLAAWLFKLAQIQRHLGMLDEALAAMQESASISVRRARADGNDQTADLAITLYEVGSMQMQAGRHQDALRPMWDAAQAYRKLATADPAAFEPCLAASLYHLAWILAQLRRLQEALSTADEAVQVYRTLAQAAPASHEGQLASSLLDLGRIMREAGKAEQALSPAAEAEQIYRKLWRGDPVQYGPLLKSSLEELAATLFRAGRQQEAQAAYNEATQIHLPTI